MCHRRRRARYSRGRRWTRLVVFRHVLLGVRVVVVVSRQSSTVDVHLARWPLLRTGEPQRPRHLQRLVTKHGAIAIGQSYLRSVRWPHPRRTCAPRVCAKRLADACATPIICAKRLADARAPAFGLRKRLADACAPLWALRKRQPDVLRKSRFFGICVELPIRRPIFSSNLPGVHDVRPMWRIVTRQMASHCIASVIVNRVLPH